MVGTTVLMEYFKAHGLSVSILFPFFKVKNCLSFKFSDRKVAVMDSD